MHERNAWFADRQHHASPVEGVRGNTARLHSVQKLIDEHRLHAAVDHRVAKALRSRRVRWSIGPFQLLQRRRIELCDLLDETLAANRFERRLTNGLEQLHSARLVPCRVVFDRPIDRL